MEFPGRILQFAGKSIHKHGWCFNGAMVLMQ